jgi:hypothetical protein
MHKISLQLLAQVGPNVSKVAAMSFSSSSVPYCYLIPVDAVGHPFLPLGDNQLHHKLALAKARAICECYLFEGMSFYKSSSITNIAKAICESLFAEKKAAAAPKKTSTGPLHVKIIPGMQFLPEKDTCGT